MKFVLLRLILGIRSDLDSHWAVLRLLHQLGVEFVTICRYAAEGVPLLPYRLLDNCPIRNFLPDQDHWQALRQAGAVPWAV